MFIPSLPDSSDTDFRTIGIVIGVHGLKGTLKVESLSSFPERFLALQKVFLRRNEQTLAVVHAKLVRCAASHLLIQFEEINSREAAEEYRGAECCIPEIESWHLPKDTYFESDLIGFTGKSESGEVVGVLQKILTGGPQNIFLFQGVSGEVLIPFVSDWIGRIDLTTRTIEILNYHKLIDIEPL